MQLKCSFCGPDQCAYTYIIYTHTQCMYNRELYTYIKVCTYRHPNQKPLCPVFMVWLQALVKVDGQYTTDI